MCRTTVPRLAVLVALAAAACTDRPLAPRPDAATRAEPATGAERAHLEALARALALALRTPSVRAQLKAELDASPYREHKVHFQRLVARRAVAFPAGVTAQADSAIPLE